VLDIHADFSVPSNRDKRQLMGVRNVESQATLVLFRAKLRLAVGGIRQNDFRRGKVEVTAE
jgi:hypothetical protein